MKRTLPWSDGASSASDESSSSSTLDTDTEDNEDSTTVNQSSVPTPSQESAKRKGKGIDFKALSRHGYKGGLSVLNVPPPKDDDQKKDWSWSKGEETRAKETEESYAERQKTRAAIVEGEELAHMRSQKEKKNFSFSQKEKRKRDLGQASRGKNYVEEEKRMLRESGVYSGFDA